MFRRGWSEGEYFWWRIASEGGAFKNLKRQLKASASEGGRYTLKNRDGVQPSL